MRHIQPFGQIALRQAGIRAESVEMGTQRRVFRRVNRFSHCPDYRNKLEWSQNRYSHLVGETTSGCPMTLEPARGRYSRTRQTVARSAAMGKIRDFSPSGRVRILGPCECSNYPVSGRRRRVGGLSHERRIGGFVYLFFRRWTHRLVSWFEYGRNRDSRSSYRRDHDCSRASLQTRSPKSSPIGL